MDKNDLRKFYTQFRNGINRSDKISADRSIFTYFINSRYFSDFGMFLCYVSFRSEADTHEIIRFLLNNKKRVAVPVCEDKQMRFFEIRSLSDLQPGRFGILIPKPDDADIVTDFSNALCLVPALAFDYNGNRLGYGGGYYDRFLSENKIQTLGFAYGNCLCRHIPSEDFDVKISTVLTENGFRKFKTGEANTYE